MQQRLTSEGQGMAGLLEYIRLAREGLGRAGYLVLFTKARREAKMQVYEEALEQRDGRGASASTSIRPPEVHHPRQAAERHRIRLGVRVLRRLALVDLSKRRAIVGEQRVAANRAAAAPNTIATEGVVRHQRRGEDADAARTSCVEEVARTVPALINQAK